MGPKGGRRTRAPGATEEQKACWESGKSSGGRASPGRGGGEVTAEWPGKAAGQDWALLPGAETGWGAKKPTHLSPISLPLTKMTTI